MQKVLIGITLYLVLGLSFVLGLQVGNKEVGRPPFTLPHELFHLCIWPFNLVATLGYHYGLISNPNSLTSDPLDHGTPPPAPQDQPSNRPYFPKGDGTLERI
jgi:hypothetical protein